MITQPVPDGARGVDTTLKFGPNRAKAVKDAGYLFIARYIEALTIAERDAILGAGLGLLAVGYSRRPGWSPTAELGLQDAQHHLEHATAAGLQLGMTLYCDLEGPGGHCSGSDCIRYVNTWARQIHSAGYVAGLYVGYGIPLSTFELYHSLAVTTYWHGGGGRPIDVRGYAMSQQAPSVTLAGVGLVDINTVKADGKGETPIWLISDPPPEATP